MENNKYDIDEMLNEIDEQPFNVLTEKDFYPPIDNRTWKSNVKNICGGDNFADYCEYIFELLEEEEYYD